MREASDPKDEAMELGDVLFALVNYAKHRGLDPEQALAQSNAKFVRRFQAMETLVEGQGREISAMKLEDWDQLWNQVKATED